MDYEECDFTTVTCHLSPVTCHLSPVIRQLDERRKLAKWLEANMPISEIADRLGRDSSTIYRDIKRSRYTDDELAELDGYYALVAQDKYE